MQDGTSDGTGAAAHFHYPLGIAATGDTVYVADYLNDTIRAVSIGTGAATVFAGAVGVQSLVDDVGVAARFNLPGDVALGDADTLYVVDTRNSVIRKIKLSTALVTTVTGRGDGFSDGSLNAAAFSQPARASYDGAGSLYVTDGNRIIRKVDLAAGRVSTVVGVFGTSGIQTGALPASTALPIGIVALQSGFAYTDSNGIFIVR